jgi:glycosyltransferase involved in cell wall biosynthesis
MSNSDIKIVQINTVVNYTSTGKIAEEIGQMIINQDWNSYIAHGRYPRTSQSSLIKIGNSIDIMLHGLKTRLFDAHGFSSKNATKKFVSILKRINPDIVHLHNLHGYYLNIPMLFKALNNLNVPVIWTLHDCWPFTGHCAYFDFVGCYKWKDHCYGCPQKANYPASYLIDRSKLNFKLKKKYFNAISNMTLVPVSKWLANNLKQSFLSKYPINIINNGIDINIFYPRMEKNFRERYQLENKFIILGVANVWEKRKGLDEFIKLSKLLNSSYQIILVGLSKNQLKNLPENIIGLRKTEDVNQLAELYSTSNVYVNPTLEDNFPTTNLEALACGTPLVTYNTGGSPEAIDENTGCIVEKGNVNELKRAIDNIILNGEEFYKKNCVDRVKNNFNKTDRYQEYINLYENII